MSDWGKEAGPWLEVKPKLYLAWSGCIVSCLVNIADVSEPGLTNDDRVTCLGSVTGFSQVLGLISRPSIVSCFADINASGIDLTN